MADVRIGISGWRYAPWRGSFYPKNWTQKRELEYASRQVSSIEINGSFYSLQRPESYHAWYGQTPEGFVFSVKGGRYITHLRRLKDVTQPLANFFASGVLRLNEKLGPFLWQLPPHLPFNAEKLEQFFDLLPRDTKAAAALARRHDDWMKGRTWTRTDRTRPLRHALEVRHESFKTEAFVKLLRRHNVALVVADTAGKWPFMEDVTSDFVYVRLHGDQQIYVSGYTDDALEAWAKKISVWSKGGNPREAETLAPAAKTRKTGRDVYVYFDNDVKVRAPFDAMSLAHKLGLGDPPEAPPEAQTIAETPRTRWPTFRPRSSRKK